MTKFMIFLLSVSPIASAMHTSQLSKKVKKASTTSYYTPVHFLFILPSLLSQEGKKSSPKIHNAEPKNGRRISRDKYENNYLLKPSYQQFSHKLAVKENHKTSKRVNNKKTHHNKKYLGYSTDRKYYVKKNKINLRELLLDIDHVMSWTEDESENSNDNLGENNCEGNNTTDSLLLNKMDDYYFKAKEFWDTYGHLDHTDLLWWEKLPNNWRWFGKEIEDIDIPLIPDGFRLELIRDPLWDNDIQTAFRCECCGGLIYFREMYAVLYRRLNKKVDHLDCKICCLNLKRYMTHDDTK